MKFDKLLQAVGDEPVFETGLLLAGHVDPADVRRQLSRWTKQKKLYRLKRGLYTLAPPYQKVKGHPFLIANRMMPASYVSLQSALAFYELIPEYVPQTTSVTGRRAGVWRTPLGQYIFRRIQPALLWGYAQQEVSPRQYAFVATPEKALLDLIYLTPAADTFAYLKELRLQNLARLKPDKLIEMAKQSQSAKLQRAAAAVVALAADEKRDYVDL